jgi:hypothetical protein
LQNFCFGGFALLHAGQLTAVVSGVAHSPQKLASAMFSKPQAAHCMGEPSRRSGP